MFSSEVVVDPDFKRKLATGLKFDRALEMLGVEADAELPCYLLRQGAPSQIRGGLLYHIVKGYFSVPNNAARDILELNHDNFHFGTERHYESWMVFAFRALHSNWTTGPLE